MENIAQLSLDEAKKLYNSPTASDDIKLFLLSKFTKEELEGKKLPSHEEFNKFFEENIFPLIDYSKTKFLDRNNNVSETPTSRIELRNSKDAWLFDYDYNNKKQPFWYSFQRVYRIFMNEFSLQDVDRHRLMKSLVEKRFNLRDTQSVRWRNYSYSRDGRSKPSVPQVENRFKAHEYQRYTKMYPTL